MRKYYQATLFIIAIISVISLLFYRHEYNKLRYVLEVFNYFGKPEHKELILDNCTRIDIKNEKINLDFDEPFTSWQRINDDLFAYSSYVKNSKEIVTLSFGKLKTNFNYNCNVYLERENKIVPGKFSYSILKNTTDTVENDEFCGYLLSCDFKEEENVIGVTYFEKGDYILKKNVVLPLKQLPESSNAGGYGFCISPLEDRIPSALEVTNFLNTHKSLGVEDFIIYDNGMSILTDKTLKSTIKPSCTKIPWNFPFPDVRKRITMSLMELDCLYRTYNKIMYTALLAWDETIVLNFHSNLNNLMMDFRKNKMFGNRFMLKSSIFCMQNKTSASFLGKQKLNSKGRHVYISKPDEVLDNENYRTMEVLPDLVEVKRYQVCSISEQNVKNAKKKSSNYRKSFRFAADT